MIRPKLDSCTRRLWDNLHNAGSCLCRSSRQDQVSPSSISYDALLFVAGDATIAADKGHTVYPLVLSGRSSAQVREQNPHLEAVPLGRSDKGKLRSRCTVRFPAAQPALGLRVEGGLPLPRLIAPAGIELRHAAFAALSA
jgi:hypothetical protein